MDHLTVIVCILHFSLNIRDFQSGFFPLLTAQLVLTCAICELLLKLLCNVLKRELSKHCLGHDAKPRSRRVNVLYKEYGIWLGAGKGIDIVTSKTEKVLHAGSHF